MTIVDAQAAYNAYLGISATKQRATGTIEDYLKDRKEQEQYELDVAMWYGIFAKSGFNTNLLKRVWLTIIEGGLICKEKSQYSAWKDTGIPVASCLSHGGRVMIQIPPGTDDDYFDWLTNNGSDVNIRKGATHGLGVLDPESRKKLPKGRLQYLNENKGTTFGKPLPNYQHYYQNIPIGGVGNKNPFSGNVISVNGEHGHLYIGYFKPQANTPGGLLIGCEGSEPIDVKDPKHHTRQLAGYFLSLTLVQANWSKDQTGHAHKTGESGEYSPTGGKKWKETSWHTRGPMSSSNGMIVDLVAIGWEWLKAKESSFDPKELGNSGNFRVQPKTFKGFTYAEWATKTKDLRSDSWGSSNSVPILKEIDKDLLSVEGNPINEITINILAKILNNCLTWLKIKAAKHKIAAKPRELGGKIIFPELVFKYKKYEPILIFANKIFSEIARNVERGKFKFC